MHRCLLSPCFQWYTAHVPESLCLWFGRNLGEPTTTCYLMMQQSFEHSARSHSWRLHVPPRSLPRLYHLLTLHLCLQRVLKEQPPISQDGIEIDCQCWALAEQMDKESLSDVIESGTLDITYAPSSNPQGGPLIPRVSHCHFALLTWQAHESVANYGN